MHNSNRNINILNIIYILNIIHMYIFTTCMYFTRYLLHKNILYDIYTCTHVAHIIARLRVVCCGAYDVITDHCTRQLFKNLQSVFYLKIYILYLFA